MSIWHEIKDMDSVCLSDDGKTIEILYRSDEQGNYYIDVPIEFITPLLPDKEKEQADNE